MTGNPLLKPKKNNLESISNTFFIIALVLIVGYCGLAILAVREKQAEYKDAYRKGHMTRDDFEYYMEDTTYLRMMLHPQEIIPLEKYFGEL